MYFFVPCLLRDSENEEFQIPKEKFSGFRVRQENESRNADSLTSGRNNAWKFMNLLLTSTPSPISVESTLTDA